MIPAPRPSGLPAGAPHVMELTEVSPPHRATSEVLAHRRAKWSFHATSFGMARDAASGDRSVSHNLSKPEILTSEAPPWARPAAKNVRMGPGEGAGAECRALQTGHPPDGPGVSPV